MDFGLLLIMGIYLYNDNIERALPPPMPYQDGHI